MRYHTGHPATNYQYASCKPDEARLMMALMAPPLNLPLELVSIRKDSTTVVDYCWLFPPPILIFANKCDLQPEPRAYDVATMLNLDGTPAYPSSLSSWI